MAIKDGSSEMVKSYLQRKGSSFCLAVSCYRNKKGFIIQEIQYFKYKHKGSQHNRRMHFGAMDRCELRLKDDRNGSKALDAVFIVWT